MLNKLWLELCLYFRILGAAINPYGGAVSPVGRLYVTKITKDGLVTNFGLVSTKVVTEAGVAYLVSCLNSTQLSNVFKFHATGTGTTSESATQTSLIAEASTRSSGTQTVGSTPNVYRTVATLSYGSTLAVTEHGIFSAVTAGTLLDRSVFAPINVIGGDSIQFTYDLTLPSGS